VSVARSGGSDRSRRRSDRAAARADSSRGRPASSTTPHITVRWPRSPPTVGAAVDSNLANTLPMTVASSHGVARATTQTPAYALIVRIDLGPNLTANGFAGDDAMGALRERGGPPQRSRVPSLGRNRRSTDDRGERPLGGGWLVRRAPQSLGIAEKERPRFFTNAVKLLLYCID